MSKNLHLDTVALDQVGIPTDDDEDVQAPVEAVDAIEAFIEAIDPEKGKVVELFGQAHGSSGVNQ